MPHFVSTYNARFDQYQHLPDCKKFMSLGRIVDEEGNPATADTPGPHYQLIAKKNVGDERYLRFGVPLPKAKQVDWDEKTCTQELERGIEISDRLMRDLEEVLPLLLRGKKVRGLSLFSKAGNNYVFTLDWVPNFIFKCGVDSEWPLRLRFAATIQGVAACRRLKLDRLVIPHAKQIKVGIDGLYKTLWVEERLPINPTRSAQEHFYTMYSSSLNEAVRQLAVFIKATGFYDTQATNMPVLHQEKDALGHRKIALIDLETRRGDPEQGFIGNHLFPGLFGLISQVQAQLVYKVAKGVISDAQYAEAVEKRLQAIERQKSLQAFYKENRVITGHEPLFVDMDNLDLDPNLVPLAITIIEKVNKYMKVRSEDHTAMGKRDILLSSKNRAFAPFKTEEPLERSHPFLVVRNEKLHQEIRQVVDALIKHGAIFDMIWDEFRGIYIQA
ncbi:MAG: hypothetical protein S4CHLAM102_08270 [Chlamydiia bacterium]|nr:hypothetical protein [Chlamydiia bacterium]